MMDMTEVKVNRVVEPGKAPWEAGCSRNADEVEQLDGRT
jgi:hypothetical protein